MKQILLLGAGLVARPLVRYLLSRRPDYRLLIGTQDLERARELLDGHPRGKAIELDATDAEAVRRVVRDSAIVVSLLPATLNPTVARVAIEEGRDMLNASYASQAIRELEDKAREAEVLVLCELGLDPGIDHMSAMKVIHDMQRRGGKVTHFSSCCGGLPSREDNDNPWGYKFSWFPKGVLLASRNDARFRRDGEDITVDGEELFTHRWPYLVEGEEGRFEVYPNRDSLSYIPLYGLDGIENMFRGTIRFPGWADTLGAVRRCGWLRLDSIEWPSGTTLAQVTLDGLGESTARTAETLSLVASKLGLDIDDPVIRRMEWAGLLSNRPIGTETAAPIDILSDRLSKLLAYRPGERDLVVMQHDIEARFPDGTREHVTATMVDKGEAHGDSSMARTVSLPLAIATDLLLQQTRPTVGVQVPVIPELYTSILQGLEELNIGLSERSRTWHPGPFSH